MKRKMMLGLVVFLMFGLVGCETLPKKFIRKKKEPLHKPAAVFLTDGAYQKQFSNEYYYKTRYTLWKTWHDDMLDNLGGNSKKLRRAAQEAYSNLEQMRGYLRPEKGAELTPLVNELDGYRRKFDQGSLSRSTTTAMRSEIEKTMRLIANDFYYEKVKGDVLPSNVDLGSDTV